MADLSRAFSIIKDIVQDTVNNIVESPRDINLEDMTAKTVFPALAENRTGKFMDFCSLVTAPETEVAITRRVGHRVAKSHNNVQVKFLKAAAQAYGSPMTDAVRALSFRDEANKHRDPVVYGATKPFAGIET